MIDFFIHFHSYEPQLAELCVIFASLLAKGKANVIEWTMVEPQTFDNLKTALRECVKANLMAKWGTPVWYPL
jgi:hypothetical protein